MRSTYPLFFVLKLDSYHIPYPQINCNLIKYIHVQNKTIKLLVENIGECFFLILGVRKNSLNESQVIIKIRKRNKFDYLFLECKMLHYGKYYSPSLLFSIHQLYPNLIAPSGYH